MNAQPEPPGQPEPAPAPPNASTSATIPGHPTVYELTLRGHLGKEWADWFEGATIALLDNGDTILTCSVADQAALHGLLKRVRDLGMPLVSVIRVEHSQANASNEE